MKYKYPMSLFIMGLITDFFLHFFFLSIPAVILLIVGIWVRPCLYAALALLFLDAVLSFVERFRIRKAMITKSSNPDFNRFQEALNSPDWKKSVRDLMEWQNSESNPGSGD